MPVVLECVVNVSEGQNPALLDQWCAAVGRDLLDLHADADHNRSVFTLVGEDAPRILTRHVVNDLDIATHSGVHPRLGVVDVVPFVPLHGSTMEDACAARDRFADWAATELDIPCFLYGPRTRHAHGLGDHPTLPAIRRHGWGAHQPDLGPTSPHLTAGAICVGAREPLIAYNVWLRGIDLATTRAIAADVRSEHIRTLGLQVGQLTQVSMNLVTPHIVGPAQAFDAVATRVAVERAELVGLIPAAILADIPRVRWEELDLAREKTIEWRLTNRD